MTRERTKKLGRQEQQLLDAARLGQSDELETILSQMMQENKSKKRSNPLTSLSRKCAAGPASVRDPITGFTCLHHAALNGHSKCVHLLLVEFEGAAKLSSTDYKGSSALHLAAWAGNLQVVRQLLLAATKNHQQHQQTSEQSTAISGAISQQLDSTSEQFIDPLEYVNGRNQDNQTAISLAAQFGHREVVAELLARGANVHLRNNQLESPLDLACLNGRLETVRLLLDSSAQLLAELRRPHSTISLVARPQNQPARAPISSGWSSLLRNNRKSSQQQSPGGSGEHQRRASLTSEQVESIASAHQINTNAAQHQRLTYAQAMQFSLDSRPPTQPEEHLLDHSPLHLAVRRQHLSVVQLLLNHHYQANVMQLTRLGSVLHELANCQLGDGGVAAGSACDILNAFVSHLAGASGGDRLAVRMHWDKLMSLRNFEGKTALDLMNTRGAHEIKRFLLETSEQLTRASQPTRQQQQVFCNAQAINSFVTMKRAPKSANSRHVQPPLSHRQDGTQTIDRRALMRTVNSQAYQQQQVPFARSNSNLIDSIGTAHSREQENMHQFQQHLNNLHHQQQQHNLTDRRNRSRSRDLGSLLMEAAQQQQQPQQPISCDLPLTAATSGLSVEQLYENQMLNQQQHSQLVRSQTDCSHLMGKFFPAGERVRATGSGGQAPVASQRSENSSLSSMADGQLMPTQLMGHRSATLDRRTINRHYHVYEHEFYPPRLVSRQAVAIVPPLEREANIHNHQQLQQHQQQQQQQQQQQLDQMNRFVCRRSRKSTPGDQLAIDTTSANQQANIHASHSFESHLATGSQASSSTESGSGHTFDSTRRQLMRDFDQMLGHELGASVSGDQSSSSSRQSVLTGVSLDMDTRGERLTVSGTRITLPAEPQAQPLVQSSSSSDSLGGQSTNRRKSRDHSPLVPPQKPPRPSIRSQQIYRSSRSSSNSSAASQPPLPVRPPSSASSARSPRPPGDGVIYDLPSVHSLVDCSGRPTGSASSATLLTTPISSAAPITPTSSAFPPKLASAHAHSLTEAPRERPPPPPTLNTASPLATTTSGHSSIAQQVCKSEIDSGVCTSNSPASLSHDSDGTQKSLGDRKLSCDSSMGSPPSPRTAQLSIAEMFIPLTETPKRTHEMANQTLNDDDQQQVELKERDLSSQVEMIFGWLGVASAGENGDDATASANKNDYENCCELQAKLQSSRCRSIGNLFADLTAQVAPENSTEASSLSSSSSSSSSSSTSSVKCLYDEDDYAATSENSARSSSSTASVECVKSSGCAIERAELSTRQSCSGKEITLKVVVDESERANSGDEVFYINPTELKKISNSLGQKTASTAEAETLTDEELSACLDKSSGYIRFTLKKRRGLNTLQQSSQTSSDCMEVADVRTCQESDDLHDLKRTKTNNDQEEEERAEETSENKQCTTTSPSLGSSQTGSEQVVQQPLRKASADSIQLDASQSSSSSEMSIKSIVSLRQQQQQKSPPETPQAAPPVKSSIVSETARKLEAAAAAAVSKNLNSNSMRRRPVAAARKTLQPKQEVEAGNKENEVTSTSISTSPLAPVRKSVCWPPRNDGDENDDQENGVSTSPAPPLGRVAANRLSFQKMIEQQANKQTSVASRPKPPPPIKPAGLVVVANTTSFK